MDHASHLRELPDVRLKRHIRPTKEDLSALAEVAGVRDDGAAIVSSANGIAVKMEWSIGPLNYGRRADHVSDFRRGYNV